MLASLSRRREVVLVAAIVLVLELTVFWDTFTGAVIPVFDFVSHYNFEAYAWWRDGSFFAPPQWMPYLWGGYPAVSNLQNSSFYLPVGIASLVGPYSLHAAAVVAALHVGFGAVGAHLLARRLGAAWLPSLFVLTAWFFGAGFYANASHLDIARGYAWLPWVLLVASTRWPWGRWWGPLLALVVLSQALLGTYPGMIVAILYCTVAWVIGQQAIERPRVTQFLLPLAIISVAAVLTTLVRFLPALLERGETSTRSTDESNFPLFAGFGTFLFPNDLPEFGHLAIFMSHALPVGVIALLPFVRRMSRPIALLIPPFAVAVLLAFPFWPWHSLVRELPGLGLSRFMESDFKVVMLLAVTVIAGLVLDDLLRAPELEPGRTASEGRLARVRTPRVLVPVVILVLALAAFLWIGVRYGFDPTAVATQLVLLAVAAVLALLLAFGTSASVRGMLAAGLIVVSAASGIASVHAIAGLWRNDRIAAEQLAFEGRTVEELLAAREEPGIQRPGRLPPPPPDQPHDNLESKWSQGFYSGSLSVYGYVNLRGTEGFEAVRDSTEHTAPAPVDARVFWQSGGMVVESNGEAPPPAELSYGCFTEGYCGPNLTTEPVAYGPASTLVYHVVAAAEVRAAANEAWFSGWTLTICPTAGGACRVLPTERGEYGQIQFFLPEGDWQLTLDYRLPGLTLAWALFAVGVLLAALVAAAPTLARRFRERADLSG